MPKSGWYKDKNPIVKTVPFLASIGTGWDQTILEDFRNRTVGKDRYSSQFDNNYFTEMCSGSEAGSSLRLIDFVHRSTLGVRVMTKNKRVSPRIAGRD